MHTKWYRTRAILRHEWIGMGRITRANYGAYLRAKLTAIALDDSAKITERMWRGLTAPPSSAPSKP